MIRVLAAIVAAVVVADMVVARFVPLGIGTRICILCGGLRECTLRAGSYTCRTCRTRHYQSPEVLP